MLLKTERLLLKTRPMFYTFVFPSFFSFPIEREKEESSEEQRYTI